MIETLDRRKFLAYSALAPSLAAFPAMAATQAANRQRLLFVIQRGAADGLGLVAPISDPAFSGLRGRWAKDYADAPEIGGMFAFHPRLEQISALFNKGELLVAHAVGLSHRDRSHFDSQNLLESGGASPYAQKDGWMNRLVGLLSDRPSSALALAPTVPLVLQGKHPASSYAPTNLPDAKERLVQQASEMYAADPLLSGLWMQAVSTREMAGDTSLRNLRDPAKTGELAASLMSGDGGARIMVLESNGWDSHAGQQFQLGSIAGKLDSLLAAFATGMGSAWQDTLVVVATEFGRTARINGTNGTDHGTASAAFLAGGAVRGGRIVTDWPGLAQGALYEGRDLKPTTSLEGLIAGAVAGHFGLDHGRTTATLFPDRPIKVIRDLTLSG